MECLMFLSSITDRIVEQWPLKYRLVRNLYCHNPYKMFFHDDCKKAFEVVLNKLVGAGWRKNTIADDVLEQYRGFLLLIGSEYSEVFKECTERINTFSYRYLNETTEFPLLWQVIKFSLLFHMVNQQRKDFSVQTVRQLKMWITKLLWAWELFMMQLSPETQLNSL